MRTFDDLLKNLARTEPAAPKIKVDLPRLFGLIEARQERDGEITGWRRVTVMTAFAAAAMLFLTLILNFGEPLPTETDVWTMNDYQGEIYYLEVLGENSEIAAETGL